MFFQEGVETRRRNDFVDITAVVAGAVRKSGVKNGLCVVFCPHTTAAVSLNENADPDVKTDLTSKLGRLIPENDDYRHAEGNSDAHVKSSLVGPSLPLIVRNSAPLLGTWQAVYFCEFDGPRRRTVQIQVVPDGTP